MNEDILFCIIITAVCVISILIYFLPFIISCYRNHSHKYAILTLNLLMGLSGVGWIASFIWAFYDNKQ